MVLYARDIVERDFLSIPGDNTVFEGAKTMKNSRHGFAIIGTPAHPDGLVTEWDILCKVVAEGLDPGKVTMEEIMTKELFSIDAGAGISEVSQLMTQKGIRRLLVKEGGKVIGFITAKTMLARMNEYVDRVSAQISRMQTPSLQEAKNLTVVAYVDGLSQPRNPGTGTYGFVIYDGTKKVAEGSGLAGREVTSNYAEYTALAEALKKLKALGIEGDVLIRSDSSLLVGQMSEGWKVKGGMYVGKLKEVRDLMKEFGSMRFEWIPREQNEEADFLTRIAYDQNLRQPKR